MIKSITALALATAISVAPMPQKEKTPEWKDAGTYRITCYDVCCNDPQGRQSASGKTLEYGDVAMNGVPFGTEISIEGEVFTVTDRCARDDTVDIFVENDSGYCQCNLLEYKDVRIKVK